MTLTLQGRCLPKDGDAGTCTAAEVTVGCLQACECPTGGVCCGVENGLVVESACQFPDAGHCEPYPQDGSQASAQLCTATSECINGDNCIAQTCALGANLSICGLQSQSPFNCMPSSDGGDGGDAGTE